MPGTCHLKLSKKLEIHRIIFQMLGALYVKHRIGSTTYQKIIDNQRPPEPTEEWRRIIESVSISDQISENNQESSHDTSFSTIIQEDGITHMEYPMDNENDANSNGLNTVTSGQKDKVSRKKKASIKLKDESSSTDKVDNAPKGSDTSR